MAWNIVVSQAALRRIERLLQGWLIPCYVEIRTHQKRFFVVEVSKAISMEQAPICLALEVVNWKTNLKICKTFANYVKWSEAYYSIYWRMMLDFCRVIFNFATLFAVLYTETHNLEIQQNWKLLKENNEKRAKMIKIEVEGFKNLCS